MISSLQFSDFPLAWCMGWCQAAKLWVWEVCQEAEEASGAGLRYWPQTLQEETQVSLETVCRAVMGL